MYVQVWACVDVCLQARVCMIACVCAYTFKCVCVHVCVRIRAPVRHWVGVRMDLRVTERRLRACLVACPYDLRVRGVCACSCVSAMINTCFLLCLFVYKVIVGVETRAGKLSL